MTISWDPNSEEEQVQGYRIYYDSDSGAPYEGTEANEGPSPIELRVESMDDPGAPSVEISGLPSCSRYYFALTAYSEAGESDYTDEMDVMLLAGPSDVLATPGEPGQVSLSWDGLKDDDDGEVAGYRVSWDVDAGEPYNGADSPLIVTELYADIDNLDGGVMHYFLVESLCPDGSSTASDEVTATPELAIVPPEPSGCSCGTASSGAPLGWLGALGVGLAFVAGRRRRRPPIAREPFTYSR